MHFLRDEYQACKNEILSLQNDIKRRYELSVQEVKTLASQGQKAQAANLLRNANTRLQSSLSKPKTICMLLASALRQLGDVEGSQKQQEFAMKQTDSDWPDPYTRQVASLRTGLRAMLSRADVALGQQRYDDISILSDAVAKYPDSLFAHIMLGRARIRTGRVAHHGLLQPGEMSRTTGTT